MSLPGLGSFGGDQTSQSLQSTLKQSLDNVGSVTVGGSGGSSSGRGGPSTGATSQTSLIPVYIIGGIAAIAMLGLVLSKRGN
jgi:hypothetical protein